MICLPLFGILLMILVHKLKGMDRRHVAGNEPRARNSDSNHRGRPGAFHGIAALFKGMASRPMGE